MKNYIIAFLLVVILLLSSFLYKNSKATFKPFPIEKDVLARVPNGIEVPLFLFVFFKKNNCHDCLGIIDTLNSLQPQFIVTGLALESELKNEKELRNMTGAAFPLKKLNGYGDFLPYYSPSIVGVSPNGIVLFTLPGVPEEKDYLEKFLNSFYEKIYPLFLEEKYRHGQNN